MTLWRLVPVARTDSSYWQDHPIWEEVIVRAPTSAQARVLAEEMERRESPDQVPMGNESLSFQSGFQDEKLYWVTRVDPADEPELISEGPQEVVRARRYEP